MENASLGVVEAPSIPSGCDASGHIHQTITYRTDAGLERKELGEGLASLDFQAIFSYGLTPRLQFDLNVAWRGTHVSRKNTDVCVELGDGACDATHGTGVIEASMKG